jgi:UPF0176 protein
MTKPELYNKKSPAELQKKLQNEPFERITCSFYRYIKIGSPEAMRDVLYLQLNELNVLGRIYLANEGVNAQISVPKPNWDNFITKLYHRNEFDNMPIKIAVEDEDESFLKLIIRIKPQIVADGLIGEEYDLSNIGKHLSEKEFNQAMGEDGTIIVDVRNHYESEVGHFEDAICPDVDTFKESLPIIKELLKGHEDDKVLLYCTGGIRCEKTSAYLKHNNFNDVNQLQGGIISYSHQINAENIDSKFKGKNFVFDKRMGEKITDEVISNCHQCYEPSDSHTNCKNQACHILFIQCGNCGEKFGGCCSHECCEFSNISIEEQRKIRKDPNRAAPMLIFKDRVRPKLKDLTKKRRNS